VRIVVNNQFNKSCDVYFRLLMYPKNSHPISTVDAEGDAAINRAIWLLENL